MVTLKDLYNCYLCKLQQAVVKDCDGNVQGKTLCSLFAYAVDNVMHNLPKSPESNDNGGNSKHRL